MTMKILKSTEDASVNFVWDSRTRGAPGSAISRQTLPEGQAIEARYVQREPGYFACYLSSQTACAMACRFCHLTATGQNKPGELSVNDIVDQAATVLDYEQGLSRDDGVGPDLVHFNFMARGEPLASPTILHRSDIVFDELRKQAAGRGLKSRVLVSTIMPKSLGGAELEEIFTGFQPEIYYSLYSMDPHWRKRWLPKAMNPVQAIAKLATWQRYTKKIVRIHHALIAGENDLYADAAAIVLQMKRVGLRADFSLIRYNPFSPNHGAESGVYEYYASVLQECLPGVRVKIVERVGPDVAASCGMFVDNRKVKVS